MLEAWSLRAERARLGSRAPSRRGLARCSRGGHRATPPAGRAEARTASSSVVRYTGELRLGRSGRRAAFPAGSEFLDVSQSRPPGDRARGAVREVFLARSRAGSRGQSARLSFRAEAGRGSSAPSYQEGRSRTGGPESQPPPPDCPDISDIGGKHRG